MTSTTSWISELMPRHNELRALAQARDKELRSPNFLSPTDKFSPKTLRLQHSQSLEICEFTESSKIPIKVKFESNKELRTKLPSIFKSSNEYGERFSMTIPSNNSNKIIPINTDDPNIINKATSVFTPLQKSEEDSLSQNNSLSDFRKDQKKLMISDISEIIPTRNLFKFKEITPAFQASLSLNRGIRNEPILAPIEKTAIFSTFKAHKNKSEQPFDPLEMTKEINDMLQSYSLSNLADSNLPNDDEITSKGKKSSFKPKKNLQNDRSFTIQHKRKHVAFKDEVEIINVPRKSKRSKKLICFCF